MSNFYGKSCTPNLGGVSDYYTKAEVNGLLASKASTSLVYDKGYIDGALNGLQVQINALESGKVTYGDLSQAIGDSEASLLAQISSIYAPQSTTYTKTQVDTLFSTLNIDSTQFLRKTPTFPNPNRIDPGSNNTVALTVKGSSTSPRIQEWLRSNNDRVGYFTSLGDVVFERTLQLGRLVSDGAEGLVMSGRRITQVGSPVQSSDAVPLSFLKSYVLDFYEEIARPDPPVYYVLDGGTY